jgi:hypothetical protein
LGFFLSFFGPSAAWVVFLPIAASINLLTSLLTSEPPSRLRLSVSQRRSKFRQPHFSPWLSVFTVYLVPFQSFRAAPSS